MSYTHLIEQEPLTAKKTPVAIVSGENIYILHPNGKVEAIAADLMHRSQTKHLLENCLFWGDIEIE